MNCCHLQTCHWRKHSVPYLTRVRQRNRNCTMECWPCVPTQTIYTSFVTWYVGICWDDFKKIFPFSTKQEFVLLVLGFQFSLSWISSSFDSWVFFKLSFFSLFINSRIFIDDNFLMVNVRRILLTLLKCFLMYYSRTPDERPPSPTTIPLIWPHFVWRTVVSVCIRIPHERPSLLYDHTNVILRVVV